MRLLFMLCALGGSLFAAVPPEFTAALKSFRTDAPRGWTFTQKTDAQDRSRLEHYDAARPEFDRWTLLQQDGRAVTADEQLDYKQKLTRRSRGGSAPLLTNQLDLTAAETIAETPERATVRCRLKPGEEGDKTAAFLRVTLVVHKATQTIESLEIASAGAFSPTFGVTIVEMKTVMTYSVPSGETPSLPQSVTTRLRGRAFWVKSLDADMAVTYSDYARAGRK